MGKLIVSAFTDQGWESYLSKSDGVFLKSILEGQYHNFYMGYYATKRGLLPRLSVNRTMVTVPRKILNAWKLIGRPPFERQPNIEITFLPDEAEAIAGWLSILAKLLERDEPADWARQFPFEIQKLSNTNLWTSGAYKYAAS